MGVVADDITGANDIGSMFAKHGWTTHVYSQPHGGDACKFDQVDNADVVIINTGSRLDSPEKAYEKVHQATLSLRYLGCRRFFNKTCSVFRGNIGPAFDAMLDALNLELGVVVLGFPKNGRLTQDGIHYVHGKKLEKSEFRYDPIHPMRKSNLVEILSSQTTRKVDLIRHDVVDEGADILRKAITARRRNCQYLILDVTSQKALGIIAKAVQDEPVLCGSSALGEELPYFWTLPPRRSHAINLPLKKDQGILIISGSLMPQTDAQIKVLTKREIPAIELPMESLFDEKSRLSCMQDLAGEISTILRFGQDVVLHTMSSKDKVDRIRQYGADLGFSKSEISRLISDTLAEVTAQVLARTGQNRLIVAGGETSEAVCDRLGVYGMQIWQEIQPGLPSCISLEAPKRLLVLKSGSFGKPDFFEKALHHLKSTCIP